MTRHRAVLLVAVAVAGLAIGAGLLAAQQTRDRGASTGVASGTARIAGRIETMEASPQPLRRVIVTLSGDQVPGGRTTITDGEGRFAFDRLPAGRFTLSGTKPAYLPGAYGANRPGRAGIPLQISAGEMRTDVNFTMARGAVLTGMLRDPGGEAVSGVDVAALRFPPPGGPMVLALAQYATSDDRGVFRIYGLMPGDYLVSSMMRPGGRQSDVIALSGAQIDDALRELQRRAGPGSAAAPVLSGDSIVPAGRYAMTPVLYPGTPAPDAATKVTLALGEERAGLDFIVRLTRMATIEGAVIDGGNPIKPLIINPTGFEMPSLTGAAPSFSWQVTPTGRAFKYTNVVPGRYTITAESSAPGVAWARTEIEVTGDDLSGITLVMQPALRLIGRVVFDGSTLEAPAEPESIAIRLVSPRGSGTSAVGYTRMGQTVIPPARVEANGRFEIAGVMPDVYRITGTVGGQPGWWLRSAIVNGVDVLDRPLECGGAGDITGAVLTFSDRQTSLSGTIQTAAGQPAPAYFIAVFPVDRVLWLPQARRIQSARAGTDGSWILRGLPPGDYFVAALSDLAAEDLADPSFLNDLAAAAVKVTLRDGEQKTQHLRISR